MSKFGIMGVVCSEQRFVCRDPLNAENVRTDVFRMMVRFGKYVESEDLNGYLTDMSVFDNITL